MDQPKWKYLSEEKFEEYQNMSEEELISTLKTQHAFLESKIKEKKDSELLKELRSEIREYRKIWEKENPQQVEEIQALKEQIKEIELQRDTKILTDLDEKKELEGGYNDTINGAKEHIEALVFCLRFHQ